MTHIRQRIDTAANWAANNPALHDGEVGWERDTGKAKIGNGATGWNFLPYVVQPTGAVSSVNGKVGAVVLDKTDIGLGNVNNTADSAKPISALQQAALNAKADATNALLFGVPNAPTAATGNNSTQIATTAFVKNVVAGLSTLQYGQHALGAALASGATGNIAVVFPTPFATIPRMTTTPNNSRINTAASLVTVNGFTLSWANWTPAATAGVTPVIDWWAVAPGI